MEWTQQFFLASVSGRTVQLSPRTSDSCAGLISHPRYLSVEQINITTSNATPNANFWNTGGCARYEVRVRKIN